MDAGTRPGVVMDCYKGEHTNGYEDQRRSTDPTGAAD